MTDYKSLSNAMIVLGLLLAIGMASAAFILGVQAKRAVAAAKLITVKGVAEKPIKADSAEWTTTIGVTQATQAIALKSLAAERQVVEAFLGEQGFNSDAWLTDVETIGPHYEAVFIKDMPRQVQNGFDAYQNIRVNTKDLVKITAANKAFLQLRADDHPVSAQPPNYLVGNLEAVKMSLIANATKNVRSLRLNLLNKMV